MLSPHQAVRLPLDPDNCLTAGNSDLRCLAFGEVIWKFSFCYFGLGYLFPVLFSLFFELKSNLFSIDKNFAYAPTDLAPIPILSLDDELLVSSSLILVCLPLLSFSKPPHFAFLPSLLAALQEKEVSFSNWGH